ncbi:MAG: hypothetical protein H6542_00015, partial [Lentimicrobiaceae bacterium]|nr:hypothetical protein [Lentimicrobiaceae bacterium]
MKEKYEKDKEFLEAIGKLIFIYQNWQILNSVSGNQLSKKLFDSIQEAISRVYIDMISSDVRGGYIVGRIVFELLLDYFTGGAQNYKNISKLGKSFFDFIVTLATKSVDEIADFLEVALRSAKNIFKAARCTLLATGCFVPGTQVMALDNNTRSIEYILPGDWVYAYRKQDERLQAGLENKIGAYTGTKSDFVYTTLSVKKNLFEIKLEIKQGTSERNDIIRLIRPGNWLDSIGISTIGDQMWLTMPEQGINGQAKVTELKPFRWSEPPIEENKQDRYDLCQVTGIFTHTSNNVWELIFDNADTVRCTFSHPIFSVDINDWRAAGELEPGERVLSKAGNAALTSKKMLPGRFTVYNLEVAELHNFLVGKSGIAVHNSCLVEELVGVLRSSYRKIFEERFIRPLEYLSLRPIEKVLADMSDVQFDRFVSQMKGVGVENKLWVKAELAKSWLFLDNIPSISNQLDLISYTVVDQFYTKLAKKISKWGLNDEEIRLLFQYYYKYDDTFNQTITELIGNDTKGLSRAFQKINEILKRTGGAKENSFFSSVIKGFSHPNPNNRKGWKWIVEYIGRSDNYIMNVLEGGFVTPKNIRFGRQITNKVTKRNRYVDVFLDGEEIKVGFELKSHKRIETLDKERFASEFVTDLLEFEDFRFAWIFELNALNYSKEVAQGHLMNLLKSNEVISLLNQCKNGNILEYTNKLESLFNLNPGENISIGNVV